MMSYLGSSGISTQAQHVGMKHPASQNFFFQTYNAAGGLLPLVVGGPISAVASLDIMGKGAEQIKYAKTPVEYISGGLSLAMGAARLKSLYGPTSSILGNWKDRFV